jgi:proton-dependent oligopeptide transporter, POT family
MGTTVSLPEAQAESLSDFSGIGGHPRGLTTLFFTEMWERFSYYGMRAILVLYMVAPLSAGGLEFDTARATSIYATYTGAVYLTSLLGAGVLSLLIPFVRRLTKA